MLLYEVDLHKLDVVAAPADASWRKRSMKEKSVVMLARLDHELVVSAAGHQEGRVFVRHQSIEKGMEGLVCLNPVAM